LSTPSLAARLRAKRSEMMVSELEAIALRLFEQRGFDEVTVEDIASEAQISVRTFYRYFPTKEDVFQHQIVRRSDGLRAALAGRPLDEPPLHSLRLAYAQQIAAEDTDLLRQWIAVIATTPSVVKAVLGGIQLNTQRVIAEFVATRLDLPGDALVPTMLAAAAQGVIQAALTQWFVHGGDLATTISQSLEVLERGIGTDPKSWSTGDR
jgi:AcrR family transcriptional regulator